jgi:hypothetical protein
VVAVGLERALFLSGVLTKLKIAKNVVESGARDVAGDMVAEENYKAHQKTERVNSVDDRMVSAFLASGLFVATAARPNSNPSIAALITVLSRDEHKEGPYARAHAFTGAHVGDLDGRSGTVLRARVDDKEGSFGASVLFQQTSDPGPAVWVSLEIIASNHSVVKVALCGVCSAPVDPQADATDTVDVGDRCVHTACLVCSECGGTVAGDDFRRSGDLLCSSECASAAAAAAAGTAVGEGHTDDEDGAGVGSEASSTVLRERLGGKAVDDSAAPRVQPHGKWAWGSGILSRSVLDVSQKGAAALVGIGLVRRQVHLKRQMKTEEADDMAAFDDAEGKEMDEVGENPHGDGAMPAPVLSSFWALEAHDSAKIEGIIERGVAAKIQNDGAAFSQLNTLLFQALKAYDEQV